MTTDHTTEALDPAWDKLWELISDIRFVMFTTSDEHGGLRARPLTTLGRPDEAHFDRTTHPATLWFFVASNSDTVQAVIHHPEVCLSYASPDADRYVSVSGVARTVQEHALRHALWSKSVQAWFPGGPDDPASTLLAVDVTAAEYWDVKTTKMVQFLKMARAVISGHPPQHFGEHVKLQTRH